MAFYSQVADDRFESNEYTRGPWDAEAQHAGPPAALLGRAVEKVARPDMRVARLTFDISRPVPIAPLTMTTLTVREGRSVAIIEAAIEPYMQCRALLIRTLADAAPTIAVPPPSFDDAVVKPSRRSHAGPPSRPPGSEGEAPVFFPVPWEIGYHTSMEVRFSEGAFTERGPATCWMRPKVALLEGEEISPLGRVLVAADSGNGVSNVLDFQEHVFINPDLTVHLVRYPVGEWVCLQAITSIDSTGIGMADTALHDEMGQIGRAAQSLFVNPR